MRSAPGSTTLALLAVVISVSSAFAENDGPIIVIEARVGAPPDSADEISRSIASNFGPGFAATPTSIASALGGRMPRPGIEDRSLTAQRLLQPLNAGFQEWSQGRFAAAEEMLLVGFRRYERNIALVATDNSNLDVVFRGMAALALCQWKLGERDNDQAKLAESRESMLRLQRFFRTRPLPREEYAPDAIEYYRKVAKEANAQGYGQLSVSVDNEHVMIFVDGQMRGVRKAELASVLPGVHDLFVQVPSRGDIGRRYKVNVPANEEVVVTINWEADSAFWATDTWTGLVFATEADRTEHLAKFAAEVAARSTRGLVAVIERVFDNGKRGIKGTVYDVRGAVIRTHTVALSENRASTMRELANQLASAQAGGPVVVVDRPQAGG